MASHREISISPDVKFAKFLSSKGLIHEFEENYRTIVEHAPDIIFIIDLKGNFLFLNQATQKITGHPLSEVLQGNLQKFVAPEYHDTVKKILNDFSERSHMPFFEVEIISSNGISIPFDIHIKAIKDQKGRIVALRGVARDITERKKVLDALQESEKKYSSLVERAKDGVVIVQDGICKFANKAVTETFGYLQDEFIGKRLFDWLPSEDKELLAQRYKLRMANKEVPPIYETRIICKDGTTKDVEISGGVIQYEGQPADMGIIRDITERKKMEKALRESDEKHRVLVENITDVIFTLDTEGIITYISPAIELYGDYKADKLTGKPFSSYVHPEDLPRLSEILKDALNGHMQTFEFRLLEQDNKVRHVRGSIRVMLENNQPVGVTGILTDITKHKKATEDLNLAYKEIENSKAKLKAIIDNAPNMAIQGYNKNGEVLFWNPFSEKLFGIAEGQVKEKNFKGFLLSESEDTGFKNLIKNILKKNKPSPLMEWSITTKTGEAKRVLGSVFPVVLSGQEPIAVATVIDITDRKKAEEKIKEMNWQIERFLDISAAVLSIENEEELFEYISQAVVEISDFNRVLISYFIDDPPYREIIGHKGVKEEDLERVKKVEMPKEKFLKYFKRGIKIGNQSCYIPHHLISILDGEAVIPGEQTYPSEEGCWHREDNLLVSMIDTKGQVIGIISVDDSKSGIVPTEETVRPLEFFANLISEIIQKRALAKIINESEKKYRELISNIRVGIFRATPDGKILEVNPAILEMLEYSDPEELLSLKTADLHHNPEANSFFIQEIEQDGVGKNKEFLLRKKDGKTFWASITPSAIRESSGKVMYYDTVVEDITERRKLQEEVKRLSVTDELTGLYNRRYFNQKLPVYIKAAENFRSSLSLIMIDIDDFKPYNDTYHHLKGDEVIREIARVISLNIRKDRDGDWYSKFGEDEFAIGDWASRFGGDEFTIILPGQTKTEATIVSERIRSTFQNIKFRPEENVIQKTISVGIAHCYYEDGISRKGIIKKIYPASYEKIATELINLADKALFRAKKSGKNKTVNSKTSIELSRLQNKPLE